MNNVRAQEYNPFSTLPSIEIINGDFDGKNSENLYASIYKNITGNIMDNKVIFFAGGKEVDGFEGFEGVEQLNSKNSKYTKSQAIKINKENFLKKTEGDIQPSKQPKEKKISFVKEKNKKNIFLQNFNLEPKKFALQIYKNSPLDEKNLYIDQNFKEISRSEIQENSSLDEENLYPKIDVIKLENKKNILPKSDSIEMKEKSPILKRDESFMELFAYKKEKQLYADQVVITLDNFNNNIINISFHCRDAYTLEFKDIDIFEEVQNYTHDFATINENTQFNRKKIYSLIKEVLHKHDVSSEKIKDIYIEIH